LKVRFLGVVTFKKGEGEVEEEEEAFDLPNLGWLWRYPSFL